MMINIINIIFQSTCESDLLTLERHKLNLLHRALPRSIIFLMYAIVIKANKIAVTPFRQKGF